MYIQLYFYCRNLSDDMKEAFIHLAGRCSGFGGSHEGI